MKKLGFQPFLGATHFRALTFVSAHFCEEFEISKLEGAFTVHSEKAEDVEAMRKLFGESIGNVELITMITDMVDTDELAE